MDLDAVFDLAALVFHPESFAALRRIKINEVDIRRKIQLPATEFPHAEHAEPGFVGFAAFFFDNLGRAVFLLKDCRTDFDGPIKTGPGQIGKLRSGLGQVGQLAQIPAADAQNFTSFIAAKLLLQKGEIAPVGDQFTQLADHLAAAFTAQKVVFHQKAAQVVAVATEKAGQKGRRPQNDE